MHHTAIDCLCLIFHVKLLYCAIDWNVNLAYIIMCVWCTLYQEGISGTWTPGWILAQRRTLFYCLQDGMLQEADLRKARCIGEGDCCLYHAIYCIFSNLIRTSFCRFLKWKKVSLQIWSAPFLQPSLAYKADWLNNIGCYQCFNCYPTNAPCVK